MDVKKIVKEHYSNVAKTGCSCSCNNKMADAKIIAKSIGYSNKELSEAGIANLGLGCGNPVALSDIKIGEIVVDLGSGAGIDCFLASKKVGIKGKIIGLDFNEDMLKLARKNAKKLKLKNVEFKKADIEKMPLQDNSVNVIISNCVINLAPNKNKVFSEAYRVLKKGGRMFISDIVLLKELSVKEKADKGLISGCVAGALLKDEYIKIIKSAGFKVEILSEDKKISKEQYEGMPLESLKIKAIK
ncbi:MAG: arsenite methyltransferase [Candidatus Nanoarchaeia archaeon]|nr:arsenite methyltransferase [Candidatus Nanoarchaeia archaeon]